MAENSKEDRLEEDDDTKREGRGASSNPPKARAEAKEAAKDEGAAEDEPEQESLADEVEKALNRPKASDKKDAKASDKDAKPGDKKDGKPADKKDAKPAEPGLMTPTNVALLLAAAGLGAFWKGWSLYRTDGRDFYSGSAWLFLIAFFLVTVSAFHFIGGQIARKPGDKGKSWLEALVPALPFFGLYAVVWWAAWDAWSVLYGPNGRSWMWMFFIALALATWGVWYAMRPPSEDDIKADRLPTRRVVLLIMLPFVTVYGMIWMAERAIMRH